MFVVRIASRSHSRVFKSIGLLPSAIFSRRMVAIALICVIVTMTTPMASARSAVSVVVAGSSGPMDYARLAIAGLRWLFGGAQEDGSPQEQADESPTEQELAARLDRLEMNPRGEVSFQSGTSMVFEAVPLDAHGNTLHGLSARWESDNRRVVSITRDGFARAGLAGTAYVTATAGEKQERVRVTVVEGASASTNRTGRRGAMIVNARSSAGSRSNSRGESRLLAHGGRLMPVNAAAPQPEQPYDVDTLPDAETVSLYAPENAVGSPPGRTPMRTATPPAAVRGKENAGSSNFTFDVPLVHLPGRGDLDVSLSLIYNSQLWHKSTSTQYDDEGNIISTKTRMTYNVDNGWPAPGFRLDNGLLESQGTYDFTLTDPDGTRHEMRKLNTDPNDRTYQTTDGTFIRYDSNTHVAIYPGGTQIVYGASATNGKRSYPVKITDRNGNYIQITYRSTNGQPTGPKISTIKDTLGRYVRFNYDSTGDKLLNLTVPSYTAGAADRVVASFYYETLNIVKNFAAGLSVTGPASTNVIRYIYFPGMDSGYRYDYSHFGMIYKITKLREMTFDGAGNPNGGQEAAWTEYNYPTNPAAPPLADTPKYTQRRDDWEGRITASVPLYRYSANEALGTSTVTAPDGTVTETTANVKPGQWDDGLVTKTVAKKGTSILAQTVFTWEHDGSSRNPRVQKTEITNDAGQTRSILYTYTSFNAVATISECDFGADCTPANVTQTALRRTQTVYVDDARWTNRGLTQLPKTVKVFNKGSTSPASWIDYYYDEYDAPTGTPLSIPGVIVMHDDTYNPNSVVEMCEVNPDTGQTECYNISAYNPATEYRGNVTRLTTYSNAGAAIAADRKPSTDKYTYDIAGNLLTEPLSCCQQKTYTYTSATKFAYPTQVARGADGQLITKATYNLNTGLVRTTVSENNQTTTFNYDPDTLRPTKIVQPDGGYTEYTYDDSLQSFVKTSVLIDTSATGDRLVESYRYVDGQERVVRTFGAQMTDASGTALGRVTIDTGFDNMGRLFRVSNPYYTTNGAADPVNPSGRWTKRFYDGLGRVTSVTLPDNNAMETVFSGNTATITDQAGKQRRQITDALGRMARLDEPDKETGEMGATETPVQATYYEYDALDNITKITQGAQVRTFKYNSLSRLTHEKQVEANVTLNDDGQVVATGGRWTNVYKYDADGLLTDSYDARGVRATHRYDDLNRVESITYQGEDTQTPNVLYFYDEAVAGFYNKGRLTEVQTKLGTVVKTSQKYNYNKMGQVAHHKQTVNDTSYVTRYVYNLIGQLTKETYPSLRAVSYSYDDYGRLESVADAGRTYVSGLKYTPHGGLLEETWGENTTAPIVHSMDYNTRLQVKQIKLKVGAAERERYDYSYGEINADTGVVDVTKNTGQVARIENFAGGVKQWQQRYSYDRIGRLTLGSQYQPDGSTIDWKGDYDYDRYGNRLQLANQSSGMAYTPVALADIRAASNRFASRVTYDEAGNVIVDTKFRDKQYKYDANGRQWWAANVDGSDPATALYDGMGQRVETNAFGETRQMVYDVFGQMIAEYKQGSLERESIFRGGTEVAVIAAGKEPQYILRDHLGSARHQIEGNGAAVQTYNYLPFGESTMPPSTAQGSSAPVGSPNQPVPAPPFTRQQYAGMYRGEAGGVDHTTWRKYDSSSGRWTSPDPYRGSMGVGNPQSFNRYSYVHNDPMNLVDPTGLLCAMYTLMMRITDNVTGQVLWDGPVGSVVICSPGGERGRKVPLTGKKRETFEEQRYRLKHAVSEQCKKYLESKGIDPNKVMDAIKAMQPFDGPKSDISRLDAGTIDYDDPNWQRQQATPEGRARTTRLMNSPVSSEFKGKSTRAVSGLTPGGTLGATIADRSNVFFSGSGLNMGTIFHEAVHVASGLGDARLAEQLGINVQDTESSAAAINKDLAAHGCPSMSK